VDSVHLSGSFLEVGSDGVLVLDVHLVGGVEGVEPVSGQRRKQAFDALLHLVLVVGEVKSGADLFSGLASAPGVDHRQDYLQRQRAHQEVWSSCADFLQISLVRKSSFCLDHSRCKSTS
jgi:hypothetical protein